MLLDNGALVCALTDGYSYPGSVPLHLAARKVCLDCVRNLLVWGVDRKQKHSSGRIPYAVALKRKHRACAALLNPSSADPLVRPSPLKCIRELNLDAKTLPEKALIDADGKRESNILKGTAYSLPSPIHSDAGIDAGADGDAETNDAELCCICFDQACTIEVQDCGRQMCAYCTLSLCCHSKPNPATSHLFEPSCPFCRILITQLAVANVKNNAEGDENFLRARISKRTRNLNERDRAAARKACLRP